MLKKTQEGIKSLEIFIAQFSDLDYELSLEEECKLLELLIKSELLSYEDFSADLIYKPTVYSRNNFKMRDFINIITRLCTARLLTPRNIDVCGSLTKGNCYNSDIASYALDILHASGLLTEANFKFAISIAIKTSWAINATRVAKILAGLNEKRILSDENKNKLLHIQDMANFADVFELLLSRDLLTQANFDKAIQYHQVLPNTTLADLYLIHEPFRLTQEILNNVFELCGQANGNISLVAESIFNYCSPFHAHLYRRERPVEQKIVMFNHSQSTHTASVHKSVSISAFNLAKRYLKEIKDPKKEIDEMQAWLEDISKSNVKDCNVSLVKKIWTQIEDSYLDSNPRKSRLLSLQTITVMLTNADAPSTRLIDFKIEVAKRCLIRLKNESPHVDPCSTINTHFLLALIWKACHDNQARRGSLQDCKKRLIDSLYDIQRGKNLNEHNVDNGKSDEWICPAGTFNKLVESLASSHSDVEIIFMNDVSAGFKLPAVIKEEVLLYLSELAKSLQTADDFVAFTSLRKQIQKEGVESIWENIATNVKLRMFQEFAPLYGNDSNHYSLKNLMECGRECKLTDIPTFATELAESKGYKEWRKNNMPETFLFFKNQANAINSDDNSHKKIESRKATYG